jgi:hypothetical protein
LCAVYRLLLAQERRLDTDALIHLPAVSEWPDFNDLPSPKSNGALFIFLGLIGLLVEQLICNQQVVGSNPTAGSSELSGVNHFGAIFGCQ